MTSYLEAVLAAVREPTPDELEEVEAALERMGKGEPETVEEWAERLAAQFVALGERPL